MFAWISPQSEIGRLNPTSRLRHRRDVPKGHFKHLDTIEELWLTLFGNTEPNAWRELSALNSGTATFGCSSRNAATSFVLWADRLSRIRGSPLMKARSSTWGGISMEACPGDPTC